MVSTKTLSNYQGTQEGSDWFTSTVGMMDAQPRVFAMNAGRLPEAFADCMSVIAAPLDMVEDDHFKGPQGRAFLGILGHASQLLLSAWIENEQGRVLAAADHFRSIFEAPDYLLAAWWNKKFAEDWPVPARENRKATLAMEIVRDELNKKRKGFGQRRYDERKRYRDNLQQFSHVSAGSAGLMFMPAGAGGSIFMPEGGNDSKNQQAAIYLVQLAFEVMKVLALSIQEFMPKEWWEHYQEVHAKVSTYLAEINQALEEAASQDS